MSVKFEKAAVCVGHLQVTIFLVVLLGALGVLVVLFPGSGSGSGSADD
jgi:hypothetical protein